MPDDPTLEHDGRGRELERCLCLLLRLLLLRSCLWLDVASKSAPVPSFMSIFKKAARSSRFDFSRSMVLLSEMDIREHSDVGTLMRAERSNGLPSFQEAPAFRNGVECPMTRSTISEPYAICDAASVHIAMTLDAAYLRGSIAAVYSVVKHATCPENIVFHFLLCERDKELKDLVTLTFPYLRFKVYYFVENLVKNRISLSVRQDLEQPLNYARNYLADILELCIHKVIYLDSDLVVVDDIAKLWEAKLGNSSLGAPEYCHANFTKYFTDAFWSNMTFANAFDGRKPCYFNTGVMVMDLLKWRQHNFTSKIESWMDVQKVTRIYELGSLPPFLLVFAGSVKAIEHRWNQHGLGGDNVLGSCRPLHPGPASLLHWSGKGKPWMRLDSGCPCPLDSLWAPYDLSIKGKHHKVDGNEASELHSHFRHWASSA
ncbi:hypothetical protein O6H91_22G025200 [Diphasiastrum complanatum]|uniref:Uncharacterized protein n=1 Tax=Diphasiastrum complanatum TaxID=34168 RepID=A0ACC2AFS8_DIPCM|nr:hypothetical protein O6H91_22G025200 [Diphasiastrum complanatum]